MKKKVLNSITWLAPGGGVDEQIKLMFKTLSNEYEIHLLSGAEIHDEEIPKMLGTNLHVCPWLVRRANPVKDIFALFWIYKFLRSHQFDIIHTHETKSSFLVRLANLRKTRLIYQIHGVVFNDPRPKIINKLFLFLERLTLPLADIILVVSDAIIQEYRRYSIDISGVQKVYSGIDFHKFQPSTIERQVIRKKLGIDSQDIVILQAGRLSISKNNQEGLRIFSELLGKSGKCKHTLWLLILGDGELRSNLQNLAAELGIEKNVLFLGFRPDANRIMQSADINMLTSLREGLPRVLVEASALGIPSICYEVEGASEVLGNSQYGAIVKRFDRSDFVDKLWHLSWDKNYRKNLGSLARVHVINHWDMYAMADRLKDIYQSLY